MANKAGILGFINIVAVFIKQEQVKTKVIDNVGNE